jgi:hypothetical protein
MSVQALLGLVDVLAELLQTALHLGAAVPSRRLLHAASVPQEGLA